METSTHIHSHVCGCCKRKLPLEAFYVNKRTQSPESYCKECRKANSGKHREANRYIAQTENKKRSNLIITQVEDPALRRNLISRALRTVSESVARKQQKLKEQESWED